MLSYTGPATQEVDMLEQMMEAGMSVCRMNFSHGSYEVCSTKLLCCRRTLSQNLTVR